MPLSGFALDTFVAQNLSKLTACQLHSVALDFPNRDGWLTQFVMRRVFHAHVPDERAALAFVLLRRADASIDEWELACEAARQNAQRPSVYFKTLRHIEGCLSALWQGFDFGRGALGQDLFQNGDQSVFERIHWLYTVGRHFDPQTLPPGMLHALWLTNDGVHSVEQSVTFGELREAVKLLGRVAQSIAEKSSP